MHPLPRIATLPAILLNLHLTGAVSVNKETLEAAAALCIYRISFRSSALWRYGYGAFNLPELACFDDASAGTLLRSTSQLDSSSHNFTCTCECFFSRSSAIRAPEDVFVIRSADFWSAGRSHDALANNVGIGTNTS